jgi:hypothetical protein
VIAQQQSAKLWELCRDKPRAAVARPRQAFESPRSARTGLNWFTEGFGTPVLQEAKALLEELAA